MERAGFVLVGGKSSRMGRDKALLPYRGRTLVEHIAATVGEAAGSVTLVGPPDRYAPLGFPVVADAVADCGPLGGILTVLTVTGAEWNLIVACDMPSLTAGFLDSLLLAAEESGGDCLIPASPSGQLEPLCAVYHRNCLSAVRQAIQHNQRKVTDALAGVRAVQRPVSQTAWFENLNTPQDWTIHRGASRPANSTRARGRAHG
jgi:molybdopterin-guanine dinucleotide biosynthesis protein A